MSKVNTDGAKNPAQKAVEANPPNNGPHSRKKAKASQENPDDPAVVVSVSQRPAGEKRKIQTSNNYDPRELRAKAKSLMKSDNITSQERQVLSEILGPDDE